MVFGLRRYSFLGKVVAACVLTALGDQWLYADTFIMPGMGVFALGWTVLTIVCVPAIRRDRRAMFMAACALLFSAILIDDWSLLAWSLFGVSILMAVLLPRTAGFANAWRWMQRMALAMLFAIAGPLFDIHRWARIPRAIERKPLLRLVSLLALPLIGCGVFVALFASANPLIADLFDRIELPSMENLSFYRLLLWILLFTLVWTTLRPRHVRPFLTMFDETEDMPSIPGVSVASVTLSLIVFNTIFAVQNGLDIAFLWSGAPLSGGLTFAEYAHRGAYPLIVTALLAGLFVLVTLQPGTDTAGDPRIRRLVILWIGQNILLVASCILRTLDYIDAYSLTRLRIAALAWMILVAVGLALVFLRLLRHKSAAWLINANALAAMLTLTIASIVDLGAVAAAWNVRHAHEVGGHGASLDLCYLNDLGPSALVSLTRLAQASPSSPFVDRVRWVRQQILERTIEKQSRQNWSWRNDRRLTAALSVRGFHPDHTQVARDCDGRPVPLTEQASQ